MMIQAIINAPWWQRIPARLLGYRIVGFDPAAGEDYGVKITMAEYCGRLYVLKEERTCKHQVCKLSCRQNGGCKIDE